VCRRRGGRRGPRDTGVEFADARRADRHQGRAEAENLQRTGSFKLRGALAKIASLDDLECSNGVVASAGNHAQAVAYGARARGVHCEVFMPETAPIAKVEAAASLAAQAGRRLVLLARLPDRLGSLARLLALVGHQGANLVDVEHIREGFDLHVRETAVQLVLETRGPEHAGVVTRAVREAGYAEPRAVR
jgi:hypothetical protein